MTNTIATIGYEGTTLDVFIQTLKRARVQLLIDVREVALSRKKGFSKSQLAAALEAAGIRYLHLRSLGDPKEGREAARAGDYRRFRRVFAAHMRSPAAQADLARAVDLVQERRACLMCFEADPGECHRTIVADQLAASTGLPVAALHTTPLARARIAA